MIIPLLSSKVKCALTLCHSNADVERSFSVNKRMITKQNISIKAETVVGLRAVKAAVQENSSVKDTEVTKNGRSSPTNCCKVQGGLKARKRIKGKQRETEM